MTSIQIILGSPPPGIEPTGAPAGESGRLVDLRA